METRVGLPKCLLVDHPDQRHLGPNTHVFIDAIVDEMCGALFVRALALVVGMITYLIRLSGRTTEINLMRPI
jgi:hypothetical protein